MKPRVVFDCMVFLQAAARTTGPAAACWQLAKAGGVELCVSAVSNAEVKDVLTRTRTQRKFPTLTPSTVEAFVSEVSSHATQITEVPGDFSLPRDPKDAPYVNLAIAANAPYLVSRDKDLLDLMQDETFRGQFPNLIILDPVSFLRAMARLASEEPQVE